MSDPTVPPEPNPPAPQRPEPVMTAWVIVRDDSSPGAPIYWSGLNRHYSDGGWSHNHQHAVRFAQMQDAEKVASEVRRTTPCHVEEHSWFVSAPPLVAPAQRPEPEADGLSELAEFWKGEYIKAVDILDRATNALTDSIMASGNDARTNMHWVNKMRRGLEELRGSAPPPVAAREEDPFCPQHGPARASNHAAAGCTCRPVPPSPPPASADLKALVRQVVDAAYEVGGATLHANSALSDQQQRYWTNRRAELLDYEKRIEKELLAHVASLTARLAAAEAETERFQQAALRGIDLAEAYGADRQKAYDKIFQPQRGAP